MGLKLATQPPSNVGFKNSGAIPLLPLAITRRYRKINNLGIKRIEEIEV
jgi:hypothetical protein